MVVQTFRPEAEIDGEECDDAMGEVLPRTPYCPRCKAGGSDCDTCPYIKK